MTHKGYWDPDTGVWYPPNSDPMTGQVLPDPTDAGMGSPKAAISQDNQKYLDSVKKCTGEGTTPKCPHNQGDRYCDRDGRPLQRAIVACFGRIDEPASVQQCANCEFNRDNRYCGRFGYNLGRSLEECKAQQAIKVKPI